MTRLRARLVPRNTLLIGLITFITTFVASRGGHSDTHHLIAGIAMTLEIALVICSVLGRRRAAAILLVGVAVCWLAVFVTDGFYLNAYRNLARALSSFF